MKHHNPHTPIMIREALGIEPRVFARYEFGREKMLDLNGRCARVPVPDHYWWREGGANILAGLDAKGIEDKVTGLVKDGQ